MFRTFLSTYPWDLLDDDVEADLDRLHGEVGITGLSVWVASPPLVELRVREVKPRVFRTRGGVFFHADERHYADTRCKPIVSTWAKGRNPFARIAEACTKRGLELRAIASASCTGRLAERHPEMACKNAFGDQSQLGLCLSNPDVQTYLCGLVSDLSSNYSVREVTLADFVLAWPEAFASDLRAPACVGRGVMSLLATCFCESCRQQAGRAGIDGAMAQRSVQTILQTNLDGRVGDQPLDVILSENPPLAEYFRWGTRELSTLWQQVAKACRCDLLLDRRGVTPESEHLAAFDLNLPMAVITRLDDPENLPSACCAVARRNELRLPEFFAAGPHATQLVRVVSQAAELGFSGVEIESLGLLPDSAFTPIKQAVRFARRSTQGP
jgi:hypothetical protein